MTDPRPPQPDPYDAEHRVTFPAEGEPAEPVPSTPDTTGGLTAAGVAPLIQKHVY